MGIKTDIVYNPQMSFDSWAKNLLGLDPKDNKGYTKVTASAEVKLRRKGEFWKIDTRAKAYEDLTMAAVNCYGNVLEGRHFYFTRSHLQDVDVVNMEVTLFVVEGVHGR